MKLSHQALRGIREACEDTLCSDLGNASSCAQYHDASSYKKCKMACLNLKVNQDAIRTCCMGSCVAGDAECAKACSTPLIYGGSLAHSLSHSLESLEPSQHLVAMFSKGLIVVGLVMLGNVLWQRYRGASFSSGYTNRENGFYQ